MSKTESGSYWERENRGMSRRRFLRTAAIGAGGLGLAAAGVGGLVAWEKTLNFLAKQDGLWEPREDREILELKLSPVPNNVQKLVGPFVRVKPRGDARIISAEKLLEQGVDVYGTVRGIKWWGASYSSDFGQGLVPENNRGKYRGKWAAIVDNEGKIIGFASENFVTYLTKAP